MDGYQRSSRSTGLHQSLFIEYLWKSQKTCPIIITDSGREGDRDGWKDRGREGVKGKASVPQGMELLFRLDLTRLTLEIKEPSNGTLETWKQRRGPERLGERWRKAVAANKNKV